MPRIFGGRRRSAASQRYQSSAGSIINTSGFRFWIGTVGGKTTCRTRCGKAILRAPNQDFLFAVGIEHSDPVRVPLPFANQDRARLRLSTLRSPRRVRTRGFVGDPGEQAGVDGFRLPKACSWRR